MLFPSFLDLNVLKTEELFIDYLWNPRLPGSFGCVRREEQYRYLRIIIDAMLRFRPNTAVINRKCKQKLYLFRKLRSLYVSPHVLLTCNIISKGQSHLVSLSGLVSDGGLKVVHRHTVAQTFRVSERVAGK